MNLTRYILLSLLLMFCSTSQALEVCYEDRPNPPEYFGSGAQVPQHPGTNIELVQLTAEKLKMAVHFRRLPWKRCLLLLKQGRVDVIPSMSYLPQREDFAVYPMQGSGPDLSLRSGQGIWHFYRRTGSHVLWDGFKLRNLDSKVGYISGYSVGARLQQDKITSEAASSQLQNLEKLARGRIDMLVGYNQMIDVVLQREPKLQKQVEKIVPPYRSTSYYLVFSKQFAKSKPLLIQQFWQTMSQVRESEEYQSLVQQYHSGKLP